jgi:hypothetical protein
MPDSLPLNGGSGANRPKQGVELEFYTHKLGRYGVEVPFTTGQAKLKGLRLGKYYGLWMRKMNG